MLTNIKKDESKMKIIKNYKLFKEAFLSGDKQKAIDEIINYISKKTNVDLYPYNEIFNIQKESDFLEGQLFLSYVSEKAIRINWKSSDIRHVIHSIDIWKNFEFETNPDYTLILPEDTSIVSILPEIVNFFNDPPQYVSINSKVKSLVEEGYDPKGELEEWEKKKSRARSKESIEKSERRIEQLKAIIAKMENTQKESDKITYDDLKIDVFKAIELYTIQVARGKSNSLIVSGMAGVGKTSVVIDTLNSIGFIKDEDYYKSTGTITTAGLYEVLFKNRNRLVIFDDCDAVLKDSDSVNLLKGALDTYPVRELSKITKGNTFDSTGMSDVEIQATYDEKEGKLLPNRFEFKGQVIFISNLGEDKFDSAILSRSLHIDVNLTKSEVIGRMKEILKRISPEIDLSVKEEALEYLIWITDNYPVKFDLNLRTLIHSVNLRIGNDESTITIGGKEEFIWKLLIKKYLIKTK
jgi:predicted 3-demethylubiquinone-9 3-methyltransferase (glyoxalase superfamily)